MPIGYHVLGNTPFTNQLIQLKPNDMLYLFSDGYIDQFGGEKNIKFLMQNFRELLSTINHHDLKQQKEILDSTITVFQGDHKQVDDMLVLGIKLG
jgi:serine phosphatase RsbU (regulator of sigma subunit)